MGIAQHKKAAVIAGICMGLLVPFGAMTLTPHDAEGAILVYDAKNVEEAIKEAIQTANILTEQQKQVALAILNTKSLDPEKLVTILQEQSAGNDDFNWCKTSQMTPEVLKQIGKEPGLLNYHTSTTDILENEIGTIENVFDGKITVVDAYKQTQKNQKALEQTQIDAAMSAQAAQHSDAQLTKSVQDALNASNNAEGIKQVQQAAVAVSAANALETRNGNNVLANLLAVVVEDYHVKNLERAQTEKMEQDSKDELDKFVQSMPKD